MTTCNPQPAPAAEDPQRRFGGIRRLYGARALQAFQHAHVGIIGIGGVGSWAAEALARSAIGQLTLIDLDHVAVSNINRQLPALDTTLGMAKVRVMAARIAEINPACRVSAIEEFLAQDNIGRLIGQQYDYLIDCIDSFRIKAALIAYCRRHRIRLISAGAAGGRSDPTRIRVADLGKTEHDALFAKTRRLLRQEYGFTKNPQRRFGVPCVYSLEQPVYPAGDGGVCREKPASAGGGLSCAGSMGSAMPVTAGFGLTASAHVLKRLATP